MKIKILISTFVIVFSGYSQNIKKIYKSIKNSEIEEAIIESSKTDSKAKFDENENILFQLSQSVLQSISNSSVFKPYDAFNQFKSIPINKADEINDYLNKYELNINKIQELIYTGVVYEAKKQNSESSYNKALEICKPCSYENELIDLKTSSAYNECKAKQSVNGYKYFIDNYPSSKFTNEIQELYCQISFELVKNSLNKSELQKFIKSIHSNKNLKSNNFCQNKIQVVNDIIDSLTILEIGNNYDELKQFIIENPASKFIIKLKQDLPNLLYQESIKTNSFDLMKIFISEYPIDIRSKALKEKLSKTKYFEISINKVNNCEDCKYEFVKENILGNKNYLFKSNEKYGIIDIKSGKAQTSFKYDAIERVSDKIAKVLLNEKWGLIDKTCKEITRINFDNIYTGYKDNYSCVNRNNKYGVIDQNGKEITQIIYEDILYESYNKQNDELVFDKKEFLFYDDLLGVKYNGKWGHIDKNGNNITPFIYDTIHNFKEGVAVVGKYVKFGFNNKLMFGVIDRTGKEIIPLIYDNINDCSDGLLAVCKIYYHEIKLVGEGESPRKIIENNIDFSKINNLDEIGQRIESDKPIKADYKWGYINKFGEIIVPLKYSGVRHNSAESVISNLDCGDFKEGVAIVYISSPIYDEFGNFEGYSGGCGLIDKTGKEITEMKYSEISNFNNGIAFIRNKKSLCGFINQNGKEISQIIYKKNHLLLDNDLMLVCADLKDKNKDTDMTPDINRFGVIDKSGKEIISTKYEFIRYDKLLAKKNNKSNIFFRGYACAKLNGKWGIIDSTGQEIIPFIFDDIKEDDGYFHDNLVAVKYNGKWGFIDKNGKEIIPFKYDYASRFCNGIATVEIFQKNRRDKLFYLINKNGMVIKTIGIGNKQAFENINIDYDNFFNGLKKNGLTCLGKNTLGGNETSDIRFGFIDNMGNEITDIDYWPMYFHETLAIVRGVSDNETKILHFNVE